MKVLVTGANGFIGLPALLAMPGQGWEATGFDLSPPDEPTPGVRFVTGDFTDVHLVYRTLREHAIDAIVHTGGVSGPMLFRDEPYRMCSANVIGTINLLEAARVNGVKRFVFLSSAQAYGDTPPPPVPEDAPFRAHDLYGATKASADMLLRAYRSQYKLDAVALRISNSYGPRRRTRNGILEMVEDAVAGRATTLDFGGDGYGRAYMYVYDAVGAIVAALKAPSFPQYAYNIASDEYRTMEEIAEVVRKVIPGARIALTGGVHSMGYRRERLDISAAERDLGWKPQWTLERGIAHYADWARGRSGSGRR